MAKIGNVLKKPERDRVEEKHPRMVITWIHYSKLVRSAYQFYGEDSEEVKELADLIWADGRVLQSLLIRRLDADEYEIIAGHKRTLACKHLTEVIGLKGYEFLPCMVVDSNDVRARWQVMSTNFHHPKSQYEIMKEIEDKKYLMETHPEEFSDELMRGRMVERLAKALHMSRSVVADYQNISHNLIDEGKEAFKEQKIDKSAAVALASLPEQEQKKLLDTGSVTHTSVKEYKKTLMEPKQEPSLMLIKKAYEYFSPEKDTDPASYKEYLLTCYGKSHGGGGYSGFNYQCSPRGLKINNFAEITWNRFMQLLDDALPNRYEKKEETLPGQLMIENTDMDLKEENVPEAHETVDYSTWKIWTENKLAEEIFYIKDLGEKKIIVRNTVTECGYTEMWYIWQEGLHLADCAASKDKCMEVLNEKAEFKEE